MKKDDRLYGLKDQEILDRSLEDILENLFEEVCEEIGESFEILADRIIWPVKVYVFRRMDIGGEQLAKDIGEYSLNIALENLDQEYAELDGDPTTATEGMKSAALAFGRAIVKDYVPWACEPTGEVIEVTREMAREILDGTKSL